MVGRAHEHRGHYYHSDPNVSKPGSSKGDLCETQLPAARAWLRSELQTAEPPLPRLKLDLLDENVSCFIECIVIFAE